MCLVTDRHTRSRLDLEGLIKVPEPFIEGPGVVAAVRVDERDAQVPADGDLLLEAPDVVVHVPDRRRRRRRSRSIVCN